MDQVSVCLLKKKKEIDSFSRVKSGSQSFPPHSERVIGYGSQNFIFIQKKMVDFWLQGPVAVIEAEEGQNRRDCWAVAFGGGHCAAERIVAAGYENGDFKV